MAGSDSNLSVTNVTKGAPPVGGAPFAAMKDAVLGKSYELSLVFVSRAEMRRLNRLYRGKDASTDTLSFPLSKTSGEIFMNIEEARKEAKKFGRNPKNFLAFLFIHGLAHLKGMRHGSRMESFERKYCARFGV